MEVRLHIDRLTIEGLALSPGERVRMVAALETELARMIARDGIGSGRGYAVPKLAAPAILAPVPFDPAAFGRALAGALHAGICGAGR